MLPSTSVCSLLSFLVGRLGIESEIINALWAQKKKNLVTDLTCFFFLYLCHLELKY